MTDEEIVKRAKDAEKRTNFGELVHSPISKGVNSAYGIGFIEGMIEYRNYLQEEPVSKQKLSNSSNIGKDCKEEPVSEDLEEEIKKYLHEVYDRDTTVGDVARHFAKWQKQQMMKDAITATILPANLEETEFCLDDYDEVKHITRLVKEENLKIGDKVKVIVIKED